jgi:hypothetical protein
VRIQWTFSLQLSSSVWLQCIAADQFTESFNREMAAVAVADAPHAGMLSALMVCLNTAAPNPA